MRARSPVAVLAIAMLGLRFASYALYASFASCVLCALCLDPPSAWAAPPAAPSPADVAAAKKLFQQGLKLYNEGSYREALAAFVHANSMSPRASIQRNIAQCHRDLKDFAAAYDAYQTLLTTYGGSMTPADKRAIQRAIEELASLTGSVRVTVADPGAAVAIDGQDAGTTPLPAPVRVNLGTHVVTVTKAGFEVLQREVKLAGGDEARIDGPLEPEVTTGHLVVSAPPNAKVEVFVDGTDVGPAPWEGDFKPGAHVVEARGTDGFSPPKPVDVVRHQRVEVALDLVARTGSVQIDTHTAEATIAIDDQVIGKGVWEGTLPAGEHQLSIEAPGFLAYKRAFLVHAGENFHEDAPLERDPNAAKYEGIYAGLALFGFATPTGASNFLAQSCPSDAGQCQSSSPLGGGLAVRVGYAFGWIAIEGMALGSYDFSNGSLVYPSTNPPTDAGRNESYSFHRFGGGGAVGARVASKDPHVRFTGSALVGVVAMGTIYDQSAAAAVGGGTAQNTSSTTTYSAPLLVFDAGVLVGATGGVKVHVGALAMLQFVGNEVDAPALGQSQLGNTPAMVAQSYNTPPRQVAAGTQLFIGPVIGFDLGL